MKEKIKVYIASVKARENQLKVVLDRIYNKVDEINLILNWYEEAPSWIRQLESRKREVNKQDKIFACLNSDNKNAHDAIWDWMATHNGCDCNKDCYYFILDDDLLYPEDYFDKFIEAIERHNRKAVITAHGSNIIRPVKDYFSCRATYGFSDELERDIYVDMAGVGCTAFHSSLIEPTLQDFPIPYCRDLWFSILCAKNDVPIISLARPIEWIRPLVTPGDTVYEISKKNEKLKTLKDRILKEQLLPLLAFKIGSDNDRYVCITDYDFDERLLNKSLGTLACVVDCKRIIFSNKPKYYGLKTLTQYVTPEDYSIGRMGSKVITQYRFIKGLPNNSKVISADADLYYLKNPFEAFDKFDFDIALTTRGYTWKYPINAGVVMIRVNDKVRNLLNFIMTQIYERSWPELIEYQKLHGHTGNDWYIDQDIWCVCWLYKKLIRERFGVNIVDIGPTFNFCPHADGYETENGKRKLREAYENKSVSILHLKSRLKELVYDGSLA